MTYTYAILDVSARAFDEIKAKLEAAEYHHAFHEDDDGKHVGYESRLLYDAAFSAVYSTNKDDENKKFWDATPSGKFEVATIKEMPWEIGKEYYIDVHPA